jgi:hypothetical protein
MSLRQSQIEIAIDAVKYLGLNLDQVNQTSYSELQQKLENYPIPDAKWVQVWTDGSDWQRYQSAKTIVHNKPINRNRFYAMIKQLRSFD